MESKVYFSGVNAISFHRYFKSDEDCYEYLARLKWEKGYQCKKCGYNKYGRGKKPFSRRCIRCKYDESPTVRTAFDRIKFSLLVAFHIVFKVSVRKKGASSLELSREFSLRPKTCWEFKWKIQQVMKSSKRFKLKGEVHVDELMIGGPEDHKKGRSKGKKRLVVVALEKLENGVGRAYAQVIERASADEFLPFFNDYISRDTEVLTDEWNGYMPLKKQYPKLIQKPSLMGENFPNLHIHIMNLKGWLRGIHHHCSKERLQGYLDEYHFRYNRRNNLDTIFEKLLKRMVNSDPIRLKSNS